jgi:hypothetical protein
MTQSAVSGLDVSSAVRYIKLGSGGSGTDDRCINGCISYIGFGTDDDELFELASKGLWDEFKNLQYERDVAEPEKEKARKQRATSATNQVKAFFEAGEETLWITFYGGFIYHARFSSNSRPVISSELRGCTRSIAGEWSKNDERGEELKVENLSGSLTKISGFQGTSFPLKSDQAAYLLTRLAGKVPSYIEQINQSQESLVNGVKCAIKTLHPTDFELLVEILFSNYFRRIGKAGGSEKFIDITYVNPMRPDQVIAVQVKSETSRETIDKYCQNPNFSRYSKVYFVFHTPDSLDLDDLLEAKKALRIVDISKLAGLVVDSGLIHWLKAKAS